MDETKLHRLTVDKLQSFLLGGKADFVVSEIDTDNHVEFTIRKNVKDENLYWVRYKSIDWVFIGMLVTKNQSTNKPLFYPKASTSDGIDKAEIFRKLILYIFHLNKLPINIDILYTGVCSVCGRKLTDPIYIEIGIGKTCLENMK